MAGIPELTLAFLESHPSDAALELQRLPLETAALFLENVPTRLAAPVLVRMLPPSAARCIHHLSEDRAVGFLRGMGIQAAAQVLRYLPEERRKHLLGQLPTGVALLMGMMLRYPENTVGAWMDPQAPAVPPDMTAAEALDRMREGRDEESSFLAIVGNDQRLAGVVTLSALLRADPRENLAHLVRTDLPALPARATMSSIREHPGWATSHFLPVVERQQQFVGMLGFGALMRALMRPPKTVSAQQQESVLAMLASPVWLLCAEILHAAVALLPAGTAYADRAAGKQAD